MDRDRAAGRASSGSPERAARCAVRPPCLRALKVGGRWSKRADEGRRGRRDRRRRRRHRRRRRARSVPRASSVAVRGAQPDDRLVPLAAAGQLLAEPGRGTDQDGQHAGGERIEGAGVTDAPRAGQAPQQADHVVAGRPDRLVEVNDPEHRRGRARARTRRAPASLRVGAAGPSSGAAGGPRVAPPAEGRRDRHRVGAPAGADADAHVGRVGLLEQHGDRPPSLRRAEQVDEALGGASARCPVSASIASGLGGVDDPAVATMPDAVQHPAPQRERARTACRRRSRGGGRTAAPRPPADRP